MLTRILLFICTLTLTIFAQTPAEPPIEPGVSHALAKWRTAHYSDVQYKLNLTLEKMSPVLKGTMEIRVNVSAGSPPYEGGVAEALRGRGGSLLILDWRKIKGFEERSSLSNVTVNGQPATLENHPVAEASTPLLRKEGNFVYAEFNEHLIFRDGVVPGENVIKLDFTSPILASGSAITRYIDKEDGSEYIYSLFVPSDASTAFPVFDQPDLKARFELAVRTSVLDWSIVSNTIAHKSAYNFGGGLGGKSPNTGNVFIFSETKPISTYVFAFAAGPFDKFEDKGGNLSGSEGVPVRDKDSTSTAPKNTLPTGRVSASKPISTYVFAFAAGPFEKFEDKGGNLSGSEGVPVHDKDSTSTSPKNTLPTGRVSASNIYVRKSQAAKFKPHAAEVFRLNREAVKYFEQYFDYKFPFPKYDLVLIPEFPFGGMEHAGATFLREASIIFPQESTKGDHITRANLIFHESAHQWFGDTVTMRWFDDLWLKEGFATFMAYKALEKIMPEANAWKVFYERVKQAAYQTDSTKGTTAIYQPIANLSAAKSAYGNIVYNKAPAFLRQAEFYLGQDKFQTAVRAFLKKNEFGNAGWEDLVVEFETESKTNLSEWADFWVKRPGLGKIRITQIDPKTPPRRIPGLITLSPDWTSDFLTEGFPQGAKIPLMKGMKYARGTYRAEILEMGWSFPDPWAERYKISEYEHYLIFPNYKDYGYGIFLLDDKSREYVLKNIQNEKDPFLRSMMWGALWDGVREAELDPRVYVELAIKNLPAEQDETITASVLSRVGTAINYYISDEGGNPRGSNGVLLRENDSTSGAPKNTLPTGRVSASGSDLETLLIDCMQKAPTPGQRITYYRAFLNLASSENARSVLKQMLAGPQKGNPRVTAAAPLANAGLPTLRTKDKFDIVTRLMILGDADAPKLLEQLEKTETGDDAKRYAYAARAAMPTAESKAKFWDDFVNNRTISESWIEAAFGSFNSPRHSQLTLPYLKKALQELPSHKRNRKIFFVNGWLAAFIGGQRSAEALAIINKFLSDNPNLDRDLRLKILENSDVIERAVKIREKFKSN